MRSFGRYVSTLAIVSILAVFALIGCSEDETDCPVCPGGAPSPTMDNLWPNEDGNSWTYDWTKRNWNSADTLVYYENPGDVPAVPSFEYVEGRLGDGSTGVDADTMYGMLRLEFEGTDTTMSGASGQNLVETAYYGIDGEIMTLSYEEIFFQKLRAARPDLEEAVMDRLGGLKAPSDPAAVELRRTPIILHGGIYEKTEDYIGTYGDVDTFLAWKFLESEISTGHEFTFQLIPSLAGDIFMHCKVLGRGTVETEYGTYKNAVECLYIIDMGMGEMNRIDGTFYFRYYEYGTITYAPGTGPIMSYERSMIDTSLPDGPGIGDSRLELVGAGSD